MIKHKDIRVLFVDDDPLLGGAITSSLSYLGFNVHYMSTLISIDTIINEFKPSIIILDVEIGDKDGINESSHLQKLFPKIPIIFISSHIDTSYVVRAIKNGGLTYLRKPFEIEELEAYILRYAVNFDNIISLGDFSFNIDKNTLCNVISNETIKLSLKECQLLSYFIERNGNTVSREEIFINAWKNSSDDNMFLNNIIAKLRKHLSQDSSIQIITIPRVGYSLLRR